MLQHPIWMNRAAELQIRALDSQYVVSSTADKCKCGVSSATDKLCPHTRAQEDLRAGHDGEATGCRSEDEDRAAALHRARPPGHPRDQQERRELGEIREGSAGSDGGGRRKGGLKEEGSLEGGREFCTRRAVLEEEEGVVGGGGRGCCWRRKGALEEEEGAVWGCEADVAGYV
eukprot:241754-Hanusia_phi.AAC.1